MNGVFEGQAFIGAHQLELAAESFVLEAKLETQKEKYIPRTNIFCFHCLRPDSIPTDREFLLAIAISGPELMQFIFWFLPRLPRRQARAEFLS